MNKHGLRSKDVSQVILFHSKKFQEDQETDINLIVVLFLPLPSMALETRDTSMSCKCPFMCILEIKMVSKTKWNGIIGKL